MTSEPVKSLRLSKVANEFNISVATILDLLKKKGITIESNPNTKIGEDIYQLLCKEFQSDKSVKEEAKKIGTDYSSHQSVSIKDIKPEPEQEEEEPQELIIKDNAFDFKSPVKEEIKTVVKTPIVEVKIKEGGTDDIIISKIETKTEPIVKEEIINIGKEDSKEIVDNVLQKTEEKEEPQKEQPKEIIEARPTITGVNVKGFLKLDSINQKTRPTKKTKEEKNNIHKKQPTKLVENPIEYQTSEETEIIEQIIESEPIQEVVEEAIIIQTPEIDEKDDNFIKTQYQKLTGPKVTGQVIDLSQFDKKPIKVGSSNDDVMNSNKKKKRKRIIKEEPKKERPTTDKKDVKTEKPKMGQRDRRRESTVKPKAAEGPQEVSQEAIEKQIKATLAKLGPLGKSKTSKYRRQKRDNVSNLRQEEIQKKEDNKSVLEVSEFVTANELATLMDIPVTKVISLCMSLGLFVSINQRLDAETLVLIAEEYGFKVNFISADDHEDIKEEIQDKPEDLKPRNPIVTVMGHVDHGKTKLLDVIRNSNVIAGEAGGITQHIGAYEVQLENGKKITFLDTPGHEAFTAMRARGAKVTDIAIIVIAADDQVMPQTIEAINHAQAANVQMVFAINKIDKNGADPEKIRQQLSSMNILVEEWGGKYQCQEISAKTETNIELLLEKVLLEAEMLELKANPNRLANGTVIESSLDKGRGFLSKLLVQNGTIRVGDVLVAGTTYGRVKAMYNERNQILKEAGPSAPILMLGLNGAPQAGDTFNVLTDEKETKIIANKRQQIQREQGFRTHKHITLDEIGRRIAIGDFKELNIIVKGDVDGSIEALSDSLLKLSSPEVQVNIIMKAVGAITESDVLLASASNAIIVAFQVRPSLSARKLAEQEQIDIRVYSIIYNAIEEIKSAIEGMLSPEIEEKILCNIEIREIFKITKVGTIAGCMVLDGKINRNTKVRIIRDGIVVYTGKLESLKRFKDDVKEVLAGQDCGLNIENYNDIKVADIIEGYEETEIKRKL